MGLTDLFILILVGLGVLWGLKSGVVRQVLGLAGLITASVLAVMYMEPVGGFLADQFDIGSDMAALVGFAGVFLAVQLLVMILIRLIMKVVNVLKLGLVNRVIGGLVGGIFASLLLSIIFNFMLSFDVPSPLARENSRFHGIVTEFLPKSWDFVASAFPQVEGWPEKLGLDPAESSDS